MQRISQNPKQPSYKKVRDLQECSCGKKRCENPKWQPRNGFDGRLMAKKINNNNSGKFGT